MRASRRRATGERDFSKDSIISGTLPYSGEPLQRDFHARMTRGGRARSVLSRRPHKLRKRYAALAAAILIPAIASAADWPTAQPDALETAQSSAGHLSLDQATSAPPTFGAPIHSDAEDTPFTGDAPGAPAARPFHAAGNALDRARAEQCLTMAIYYEAATEPDDGQRAVAQVVLNRVAHPSYPNTVCGVVFQGSERSTGCQFSFTCDGSLARRPAAYWWDRARRVAQAALAGFVYAPVGLATHYHTLQVHPSWSNSLIPVATIGAHRFYRWAGAAGQKAAFTVAYLGGEPIAAPHPRAFSPAPDSDPDPVALARAYDAALPHTVPLQATHTVAAPAPAYSAEVEARGGDALFRAGNLPGGGDLSPELERSGQWLQRP
jgi:spore germination cell wall hydrolase CwlJ-like protein